MTLRLIISVLAGFFLLGGGGYAGFNYLNKPKPQTYIICPADIKQCKEGITVGRISPSCEFALCPEERPVGSGGIRVTTGASIVGAYTGTLEAIRENGGDYRCSMQAEQGTTTDVVYSSQGELRADLGPAREGKERENLILGKGVTYAWSGSTGVSFVRGASGGDDQIKKILSLDHTLPMTFECEEWMRDPVQFTPPQEVTFKDVTPVSATSTPI